MSEQCPECSELLSPCTVHKFVVTYTQVGYGYYDPESRFGFDTLEEAVAWAHHMSVDECETVHSIQYPGPGEIIEDRELDELIDFWEQREKQGGMQPDDCTSGAVTSGKASSGPAPGLMSRTVSDTPTRHAAGAADAGPETARTSRNVTASGREV